MKIALKIKPQCKQSKHLYLKKKVWYWGDVGHTVTGHSSLSFQATSKLYKEDFIFGISNY